MKFAVTAITLGLAVSVAAMPAQASGSKVSSPLALAKQADKLKPGDWVWVAILRRMGRY